MDTPKSSTIEVYTLSCLLQILITLSLSVPIHRLRYHTHSFDPFTARVCKITRLKDARRRLQSVHCSQYSQYIAVSTVSTLQSVQSVHCTEAPAVSTFSGPVTYRLSMLCVWMKILSRASAKKKRKGLRVSNFALLLVVFN